MTSAATKQVDSRVVVETPEGVDFAFRIAGPGVRLSAWVIDLFIRAVFSLAVVLLIPFLGLLIGGVELFQVSAGLFTITSFLLSWFYGSLYEGLYSGQTPGKKYIGLRVIRTNGTPVDLLSATGRNFLRIADFLPGTWTVALICMFSTRRLQRLGDLCFDTMVIQENRAPGGRSAGIIAGVEPLTRSECTKRYHVPDRTLAIIERLFSLDRIISDARREELAKPLSIAIRKRIGWRPPGPDPLNPHPYFQNRASEHTRFLRQVLKTFAVDESLSEAQAPPAQRMAAAAIAAAVSRTASKAQSPNA
ncbi:MAG: hypothetical protein RLZZ458_1385 [Planctomycetota bacterium]|jgi:uncharacterized RDD family membrane protein YckC